MTTQTSKCWICGDPANTGEHTVKKSVLKEVFLAPNQQAPLRYHRGHQTNLRVGSFDSYRLKSGAKICEYCNSARTQPFDEAWHTAAKNLLEYAKRKATPSEISGKDLFDENAREKMRAVHLYFVKLFGCQVAAQGPEFPAASFAAALRTSRPHPHFYLRFELVDFGIEMPVVGVTDMEARVDRMTRQVDRAYWTQYIGGLNITMLYHLHSSPSNQADHWWHPRQGTRKVLSGNIVKVPVGELTYAPADEREYLPGKSETASTRVRPRLTPRATLETSGATPVDPPSSHHSHAKAERAR